MSHVMLDIETLGASAGSVVLSIGACKFTQAEIGKKFYQEISIGSSLLHKFTIDPETVAWWRQQSKAAQVCLYGTIGIEGALRDFAAFIGFDDYIWAKGPDFDCVILNEAYRKLNLKCPWRFRNTRDVRTIMYMSNVPPIEEGVEHLAIADAIGQAKTVQAAYAKLGLTLE